ncbi:MAG TPA: ComEC/Rec2 family competence protein, partial [Dehalococcoidales bacterium]|nr:ComEC/Rec2 family competence protein [Dehalococcoidales bacterium]
ADILGRQKSALNGLIFAAALMVGVTPSVPKTASFQLSFLATFGLVTVAPVAQAAGRQWTSPRHDEPNFFDRAAHWITDNLAVTVSVLLVIWPLLVYYFGTFSLIGPVATILLVPVLPAIILTGTAAATLALFIAPVGQAIGWLAWLFLTYLLAVIKGGAALPLVISNLRINYTVIWLYYFILSLVILGYKYQMQVVGIFTVVIDFFSGPVRKLLVPGLLVCAILATGFNLTIPGDLTRVSFLDVGQGDAALIQKGTREILVDGGPDTGKVIAELSRRLPFWDRTIELVVVTHPHADHLTGLLEVARRYHIGQVLYADIDSKSALWLEFQNLLARKKITATAAVKGQNIATGSDLTLDIIRAAAPAGDKDIDSASLVLRIDDRQVSFLLTADISTATENELLQERANLSADVLKVAHHGSATSSSAAFLAVVKPSAAVISVGKNNDYGHPDAETVQRLDRAVGNDNIYRTDINGTVEFTTDGEKLWVRTSKQ